MSKFKIFSLPGGGNLHIRSDSIIATVHAPLTDKKSIDVYCVNKEMPFHIPIVTDNNIDNIINYIWDDSENFDE